MHNIEVGKMDTKRYWKLKHTYLTHDLTKRDIEIEINGKRQIKDGAILMEIRAPTKNDRLKHENQWT